MGLALSDLRDGRQTGTPVPGTGLIVAQFDAVDPDTTWLVSRVTVSATGQQCRCDLYVADPGVLNPANGQLRDTTNAGALDVAEYPSGLLVPSGSALTAVWTGATTGATTIIAAQWGVYIRTDNGGASPAAGVTALGYRLSRT